jgi:L-asparagine oxygenase
MLGTVVRFENEGDYLIEVKEDPTLADKSGRPGFASSGEFFLHTDLSYVESPPQFMCLHSVANDAREGGFSEFADVVDAARTLDDQTVAGLQEQQYGFPAPKHYKGGGEVLQAILSKSGRREPYEIRFRRDNLNAKTRDGICNVARLVEALSSSMTEVFLEPNSMVIVDNRRVLHGRTAFVSGLAREPRHINRLYFEPVENDLFHY